MAITITDLNPLVYDPARSQQMVLSNINNHQINEPTNPFIMLVEAATTLAAASAIETTATLRKMYPSLAADAADILPHVTDKEITNVFSYPSETNIVLYLSIRDIRSNGNYVSALGYFETIIPLGTVISVTNIPFTLLNDIHVKLYDTGVVFAEQLNSPELAANNSLGILPAGIVNFQDGEPWVAVETPIKQLNKNVIVKTVTAAEGFALKVKHTDKYYYSNVYFKNNATSNNWMPLTVSHSDIYINPAEPTVMILVLDNLVTYYIPDTYLISGQISGEIMVELYETLGYLDLPIYKYNMSEYIVKLNTVTSDPVKATINNITVFANSRDIVNGGKTGYTFEELRASVIYNTLGHEVLPVTTMQLAKSADKQGFELYKLLDMVTERVFVATRNVARYDSKLVYTRPDIFFNSVRIDTSTVTNSKVIIADAYAMIPSGTVFEENNGIVTIVPDLELTALQSMGNQDLISDVNKRKLFFTPYYYVINTTDTAVIETRVYDLDSPALKDIRIIGKNTNMIERVNVGKYGIYKTDTGYDLVISILGSSEFDASNTNLLKGQLAISVASGTTMIYFEGIYDSSTKLMTFRIDSNFNINDTDLLEITNGLIDISRPTIDLSARGIITLFTTDTNLTDNTNYLVTDIHLPHNNLIVFDQEEITITFGVPIPYIWNKLFTTYTDRKYLTYTNDKPLMYAKDVYEVDPITGSIITIVNDVNGVPQTVKTLLHAAGDPVLDNLGAPVYEYRAGDVILDSNSLPTIDLIGGVIRHADILMIGYEYMLASSTVGKNYLVAIRDTLNGWLLNSLETLNSTVLENTKLLYRSYKRAEPVEISVESVATKIPYTVKPRVIIYSARGNYTTTEMLNLQTEIGYLIHSYLDKQYINLAELKTEIISSVDSSIVSVRLENIESYRNSELFNIANPITRLAMGKVLNINSNNELVVNYDVTIKIHKI